MGQIIGVLELERHECGALGAPNCFPPTFSVATLKSIGLTGKSRLTTGPSFKNLVYVANKNQGARGMPYPEVYGAQREFMFKH